MSDPNLILDGDREAVVTMARAAAMILSGKDDGASAYVECRLAAPAILARHPDLGDDPQALAWLMVRRAADAALVMIPPVLTD